MGPVAMIASPQKAPPAEARLDRTGDEGVALGGRRWIGRGCLRAAAVSGQDTAPVLGFPTADAPGLESRAPGGTSRRGSQPVIAAMARPASGPRRRSLGRGQSSPRWFRTFLLARVATLAQSVQGFATRALTNTAILLQFDSMPAFDNGLVPALPMQPKVPNGFAQGDRSVAVTSEVRRRIRCHRQPRPAIRLPFGEDFCNSRERLVIRSGHRQAFEAAPEWHGRHAAPLPPERFHN